MSEDLLIAKHDGVAVMTFNRPDRMNALTARHLTDFGDACRALSLDPDVRVVVVTGAGRAFSAGADLGRSRKIPEPDAMARPVRFKDSRLDFITPVLELRKPTIAAVNGVAVGAGLGVALACDMRFCGASGAFLANFNVLGLAATDGVPYLLPRLVGTARAYEMLYLGETVGADDALRLGLVNRVVADDKLMAETMAVAQRIAATSPVATQMTKAAVSGGLDKTWPEALVSQELSYLSSLAFGLEDMAEAAKARMEGRAPQFRGSVPWAVDEDR